MENPIINMQKQSSRIDLEMFLKGGGGVLKKVDIFLKTVIFA